MSDCICGYKKLWDRNIFLMIYEGEKMITYEWVQELQKISPPDRLRLLAKEDSLMQSCELILLSLNSQSCDSGTDCVRLFLLHI